MKRANIYVNMFILCYVFKLTQPIDNISTQETSGTKHCGSDSTGGGAPSFPFGDDGIVQLPMLDCRDCGS